MLSRYAKYIGHADVRSTENISPLLDMTSITYKTTAAKILVLWNLPALLILGGIIHLGTTSGVIV